MPCSTAQAAICARALALLLGAFALMGAVPGLNTAFGLVPVFGHDVWLHALEALAAAYFGFLAPAERALQPA